MAMRASPLFEQVSAGKPGEAFVPSGLYCHLGDMSHGRLQRVPPAALRTMEEWLRVLALPAQELPQKWRCPMCLAYLPVELDELGQQQPCTECGYAPFIGPADDTWHNRPMT